MKQHMLVSTSATILNLHIFIFMLFLKGLFCLAFTTLYEDCAPRNCGDVMNVSFPFHIRGLQHSYCGYPGYELDCNNNGSSLIIQISGNNYSVEYINNEYIRLRNSLVTTTCPLAIKNLTLDNDNGVFRPEYSYSNVVFLMNCTISELPKDLTRYRIGSCDQLVMNEDDMNLGIGMKVCTQMVVAPVEYDYYNTVVDGGNYTEVMKRGFQLFLNAPDCRICTESGGRCGYASIYFQLECYCPNSDDTPASQGCPIEGKLWKKKLIIIGTVDPCS